MRLSARHALATLALTIATTGLAAPAGAATGFADVEPDTWYTEPVAWLVNEGITIGTSPGCFSPDDAVTRGQVATFLFRLDRARGQERDHRDRERNAHWRDDVVRRTRARERAAPREHPRRPRHLPTTRRSAP